MWHTQQPFQLKQLKIKDFNYFHHLWNDLPPPWEYSTSLSTSLSTEHLPEMQMYAQPLLLLMSACL